MDNILGKYMDEWKDIDQIIKNDKYMKWIEKYLLDHESIKSDMHSDLDTITFEQKNINRIDVFFRAIDKYCRNNYIAFKTDDFYAGYIIKYNDSFYRIGFLKDQEMFVICDKTNSADEYLEFNNIIKSVSSNKAKSIRKRITKIENIAESLMEDDVPSYHIDDAIKKIYSR